MSARLALLATLILVCGNPASVFAQATPCAGEDTRTLTLRQHLAVQHNPNGAEHHMRLGVCTPFGDRDNILTALSHVELGVLHYFTPSYYEVGGYLEVVPISPLVLRVEFAGLGYWPLGIKRTGYVERSGYDDEFENKKVPLSASEFAAGTNVNFIAIPRIKIPLFGDLSLVGLSQFSLEHWRVGEGEYYVALRRDLIAARTEWIINNEAVILFDYSISNDMSIRLGGFDSWRTSLGSGYVANQVGGMAMVNWPRPFEGTSDLSVFLRSGVYTEHGFREGEGSILGGVIVSHALTDL